MRFTHQMREGLSYVWRRSGMRMVFLTVAAVRFFIVPFTVLLPFYVGDHLRVSEDWFGYLVAGFGAGLVIGYVLAGALRISGKAASGLIAASLLGLSVLLGALGLTRTPLAALALLAAAGLLNGLLSVKLVTVLQMATPQELRGRVFGLLRTTSEGLTPAALLLSGVVADLAGRDIPSIFLACGGILVVVGLLAAASSEMRAFLAGAGESPQRGVAAAATGGRVAGSEAGPEG